MGVISRGQRKSEEKLKDRAGAIKAGVLMGVTLFMGFAFQIIGLHVYDTFKSISYST